MVDAPGVQPLALSLALAAALVMLAPAARADASAADRALAQALFDDGRALLAAGRYAEACEKLEKSEALDPSGGTLLNLALCHEKQNRTATAWIEYHDALMMARNDHREERVEFARTRIEELKQRLSFLTIKVPAEGMPPGLEILRNRAPLKRVAWNTAAPVDPGPQVVVARAPGYEPWSVTVVVGDHAGATAEVPASLQKSTEVPPAGAGDAGESPVPPRPKWGPLRVTSVVLGGAGLAGIVVGSIFGAKTFSDWHAALPTCKGTTPPLRCDPPGKAEAEAASRDGAISTAGFVAGGIAVAGAVILFVTAPKPRSDATAIPRLEIRPTLGPGRQGITLGGVF
jgi:hypothetical protein